MFGLLICSACLLSAPPDAAGADLAGDVRRLVRSLNADQLTDRDAAEKELLKLGPNVLPLLPALNERTPADVAQRIGRIRRELQLREAQAAGQPSLVTLQATLPLSEILAAISKQTGNKIVDHRKEFGEEVSDPKLSVDFAKTPFWKALDDVLDQAQLTVYGFGGERAVYLVSRPEGQLPRAGRASYSGPFRMDAVRFEALRDLHNPTNRSLKLVMEVSWEPRLAPISINQPLSSITAAAADGQAIEVVGEEAEPEVGVNEDAVSVELTIPFTLPDRKIAAITHLKGKLKTLLPGTIETFRFDELPQNKAGQSKKVELQKGGVTVIVDQVRKNNDTWELQMRSRFDDPANALESHRGWIFSNEAYLVGKNKKRILPGGYEQTKQAADEVGIKYLFDLPAGPAGLSFVYKSPLAILELPLEYELKDLELP